MSQRLSESAVHDLEARGLGRFTTPLGYRKDGQPFYLIGGASPDDPSNDGGAGAGGNDSGGSAGGSEGQTGGDGGTGEGADGNKSSETISKAEYDKLMARMQAADRSKSEVEKKLKELEEKDLSEQEKVLKRVPELEATVQTLTEENKGLKAKVAFLGLDGFSWHDPDVALAQVDLSEATNEDGSINKKELKKAAEALAKEKSFLVKAAADDKGSGGQGGQNGANGNGSGGQGSSGSPAGSGNRGGTNGALDEAALRKKYPALNL